MALQADATVLSVRSTAGGANEKISVIRLSDSGPGALTPVITAGGPLTFCNGGNVRLASDQAGAIQWFRNNSVIAGAIDIAYVASQTGSYTVLVSNANGCGISSPVNVTVRNNPPTPPMNWSTPQFSTTAGYINYEWFLNNTIIAGVDSNVFKPTQTGEYKVIVTDNFGCKTSSDKFILRILAVNDIVIGDSKINYYPNPVQTILTIDVTNPYLNKLEAQLYDVSGKLVYKQSLDRSRNQLGLQKLPTGVYQLIIRNEAGKVSVKIFVTR
jgi:hypothetical protein